MTPPRLSCPSDGGQGRPPRFVEAARIALPLSPQLLEVLRDWWRIARPQIWLFPGRDRINPMATRQLNRVCHMAAELASLPARSSCCYGQRKSYISRSIAAVITGRDT